MTFFIICTSSCRTEYNEEIYANDDEEQPLNADSKAVNLMARTAMNDGSIDNILDGSTCFNIKLPVTISINSSVLTINSTNDFELIENIIDELDVDIDALNFTFPITLVTGDFSEIIIKNENELQEKIENCEVNEEDEDIECIDFKYPFSMSVFNQNSELLRNFTFDNDNQLYRFIRNLKIDDIVSIGFPITLIFPDNTEIIINNLEDLETTIENANIDCDEDDANLDTFRQKITSQTYKVQKFKNNQNNQTNIFKDYTFSFSQDGNIKVTEDDEDIIINGTWRVRINARGILRLKLNFEEQAPFRRMNKNWKVKKILENRILLDKNNDQGSKDQLFFKSS